MIKNPFLYCFNEIPKNITGMNVLSGTRKALMSNKNMMSPEILPRICLQVIWHRGRNITFIYSLLIASDLH